jgi:hypothetical protein
MQSFLTNGCIFCFKVSRHSSCLVNKFIIPWRPTGTHDISEAGQLPILSTAKYTISVTVVLQIRNMYDSVRDLNQ